MTVKARAVVTIDVDCKSNWSDTTTMKQIIDQATTDAREQLDKAFGLENYRTFSIIGKPKITVIRVLD